MMRSENYTFALTAEVPVGPEKVKFTIHPRIVGERSTFLKAALAEKWNAGGRAIELKECDPEAFEDYLLCVYQGPEKVDKNGKGFRRLIAAYILADSLGDLETANLLADGIIGRSEDEDSLPDSADLKTAFDRTPESSPLRRLFVDFYIYWGTVEAFDDLDETIPSSFFLAFARKYRRLQENGLYSTVVDVYRQNDINCEAKCYYHQHDASNPTCKGSEDELKDTK